MKRLTLALGVLSLAAVLAACSGSSVPGTASPSASGGLTGDNVTILARDLKFDTTEITVPADEAFDLVLDNEDSAPHNVAIYADSSAATKVSVGDIFSGPAQKIQSVPALAAGTYFFRCDVHPDMKGSIVAE
jgi:plastocyanin